MKSYWITAAVGALVAGIGVVVMYMVPDRYSLGVLMVAGGLIVGVLGLIMRFVMMYMDKDKAAAK